MTHFETTPAFTDRERRWLVHIFAALQHGIQEALECDTIPFHDPSALADMDRFGRLWTYVQDALTACMERTHAEEALVLVSGLLEREQGPPSPSMP